LTTVKAAAPKRDQLTVTAAYLAGTFAVIGVCGFYLWRRRAGRQAVGFCGLAQRIIWRSGALIGIPTAKEQAMPELAVSREKIAFLIEKAQEFDVKDLPADEESGSNPTDDAEVDVLQDDGCDAVAAELASFIRASNEDEQIDLVALMWLGRGDGTIDEWEDLRTRAAERRNGYRNPRRETVRYLLGEPLLGDFLAEGLDRFGISWVDEAPRP
jgi:Protein of unknown function (DUF3775)